MMTRKELTADQVNGVINETRGNLSAAAKKLGCSRPTLYAYIKDHPTCLAVLDTARESMIDNVESVLYSKALEGEAWAVCFFLKTQGKHRGYIERTQQEISGAGGGAIETRSTVEVIPIDYRTAITPLAPRPVGDSDAPGESENSLDGTQMG